MSLLDRLPHRCTAKRRTSTKDELAGWVEEYSTILFTNKPCWRQQAGAKEIENWQQRGMDVNYKIFFNDDPGLTLNDVLVMGSEIMDVKTEAMPDASAGLGVLYRVMVQVNNRSR